MGQSRRWRDHTPANPGSWSVAGAKVQEIQKSSGTRDWIPASARMTDWSLLPFVGVPPRQIVVCSHSSETGTIRAERVANYLYPGRLTEGDEHHIESRGWCSRETALKVQLS